MFRSLVGMERQLRVVMVAETMVQVSHNQPWFSAGDPAVDVRAWAQCLWLLAVDGVAVKCSTNWVTGCLCHLAMKPARHLPSAFACAGHVWPTRMWPSTIRSLGLEAWEPSMPRECLSTRLRWASSWQRPRKRFPCQQNMANGITRSASWTLLSGSIGASDGVARMRCAKWPCHPLNLIITKWTPVKHVATGGTGVVSSELCRAPVFLWSPRCSGSTAPTDVVARGGRC